MKKFTLLLLLVFFSIGNVFAEEVTIDGLHYTLNNDGTAIASSYQNVTLTGAITIPASITSGLTTYQVTALADYCFMACDKITSVNLPDGLVSLGNSCFNNCMAMETCNIPNTVKSIGDACFQDCKALKSLDIQGTASSLKNAFSGCTSLTSVNIPSSVTNLDDAFSGCTSLTSVNIPSSVTNLDDAFSGCTSLTSVNIPASATSLERTFIGCTSLASVTISASVTSLQGTFSGCTSLTSVNIPASVTSLERTFEGCTSLVSINIPASVTSLMRAFSGCTSLSKAYCNWNSLSNIQTWGDCFVFGPTLSVYLIVPKGMVDLYKTTSPWSFFQNIVEQDSGSVPSLCSTPTINYNDKELNFMSATDNANVHYDITSADMKSGDVGATGSVPLVQAYKITAYATKDGFIRSDNAVAMLYFVNGTLDNPTAVKAMRADSRGILVTSAEGRIMVSGLNNGEKVSVYSTGGVMLGMGTAYAGQAEINVSTQDAIVVIKVGNESIKYAM